MKSASIPSLRVDPKLRQAAEAVLREGESLSSFMEESLRDQVTHRQLQHEFVARALASRDDLLRLYGFLLGHVVEAARRAMEAIDNSFGRPQSFPLTCRKAEPLGRMVVLRVGPEYVESRSQFAERIALHQKKIAKTVDLFSRIKSTEQAEEVMTVLYASRQLKQGSSSTDDEEQQIYDFILDWKKSWNSEEKRTLWPEPSVVLSCSVGCARPPKGGTNQMPRWRQPHIELSSSHKPRHCQG